MNDYNVTLDLDRRQQAEAVGDGIHSAVLTVLDATGYSPMTRDDRHDRSTPSTISSTSWPEHHRDRHRHEGYRPTVGPVVHAHHCQSGHPLVRPAVEILAPLGRDLAPLASTDGAGP